MKNKNHNEAEQYFAAKNRRREWWKKNGPLFITVPAAFVMGAALFFILSVSITQLGLWDRTGKDAVIHIMEPRFRAVEDDLRQTFADHREVIFDDARLDRMEQQVSALTERIDNQPAADPNGRKSLYLPQFIQGGTITNTLFYNCHVWSN